MAAERFCFDDQTATARWATLLAAALDRIALTEQRFAVYLSGDLGSGKTTLVRYLLTALGIPGPIKSPSFALLEPYNGPSFGVYHFDLYRFSSADQWRDAGFDEIVDGPGLVLVEWPEQAAGELPPPDLQITLDIGDQEALPKGDSDALEAPSGRRIATVTATGAVGQACLSDLAQRWRHGASG